MARLRSKFWVILVCVGTASGLLTPQHAQALGCWGCGGGHWLGGGWGGCGGGCNTWGGGWGGGCCGRTKYRCKYKMKCRGNRRGCCGFDGGGYGWAGGYAGGGCGCGVGGGGYATGGYGAPTYTPGVDPTLVPPSGVALPPPDATLTPTPASPAPVPPAPDASPAPVPETSTQLQRGGQRALALQSYQLDVKKEGTGVIVYVPEDAVVFVNDHQMKTKGTERHFSADKLQPGKIYEYDIRAEMVRNGAKLVRTEHVVLKGGHLEEVAFDFSDTVAPIQTVQGMFPETKLTVIVPQDASVYLAGEDTVSVGKVRKFVTDEIADGKAWKDYEIRVEVERDGKTVVKSKKISLFAGDDKELEFSFDGDKNVASSR